MNCREVRPLLARYVDDEVAHNELALIEYHLAECPLCSEEVAHLRIMRHRVQREINRWAASTTPPASAWDRFLARLADEKENSTLRTLPIAPPHTSLLSRIRGLTTGVRGVLLTGLVTAIIASIVFLSTQVTPVVHDENNLQDAVLVDNLSSPRFERQPKPITRTDLVKRFTTVYVLKTLPDGFRLKISATIPTAYQDYFLIDYRNRTDDYFSIQSIDQPVTHGDMDVQTYRTANALTVHIMDDRSSVHASDITNGVIDLPEGGHFLLASNLPRAQVKSWIENLVSAKADLPSSIGQIEDGILGGLDCASFIHSPRRNSNACG